ncbi:MAG: retroviral-like aspartic protease family protein, partial [Kangiellaceae bacterium]|nr:retroviral-like aspartic protease family protein [Kangiellaceae bacterium]
MASRADVLPLDDPAMTEAWLRSFAALSRSKKLKDSAEDKQVTDLFLAKAGVNSVRVVSVMAQPKELENMNFSEIRKLILEKIQPKKKLVIAERSNFMSLRQDSGEPAQKFAQRLRDAARHCEFNKLNAEDSHQTAEDELIQTMLISGLHNAQQRAKTLEHIQSSEKPVALSSSIDFVQQLELIQRYSGAGTQLQAESAKVETPASIASVDKNRKEAKAACRSCGLQHQPGRCPAFGKTCNKCHKKNHFAAACRSQPKAAHEVETGDMDEPEAVFTVSSTKQDRTSNLKSVLIEGHQLLMQLDSGSDASIIPRNFWQQLGEPKLRKCSRQLRQFDGSAIKTLGSFTAVVELEHKVACVDIVVAACSKTHGLLGTDLLQFDLDAVSLNSVKQTEGANFGRLRGFQARILLKDQARPSYFEARPVPVHLKPLVVQKLRHLVDAGILEAVQPGGSEWASPIVVVRKPDGDLRICAD